MSIREQAQQAQLEQQELQAQQALWTDAITTLNTAIEKCPDFRDLWDIYRVLTIAYANQGEFPQALEAGAQALELAPEDQKPVVQQLLDQFQQSLPAPQP